MATSWVEDVPKRNGATWGALQRTGFFIAVNRSGAL
jgi:hypothetical protein